MRFLFFLLGLFFLCTNSYAQELEEYELPPQGKAEYKHCCGGNHKNEIGIANAPFFSFTEKAINYGLHIHYIRAIGKSPYGIGLGYKRIFDERQQQIFSVAGSYRSCSWVYNVSPGFTLEEGEGGDTNLLFAINFEAGYERDFGNFHIGPFAEIGYFSEDVQFGLGLHIGYGF